MAQSISPKEVINRSLKGKGQSLQNRKTIKSPQDLNIIENFLQRRITLSKRRRGLLKKALELASICDQQIFIAIFDK